MQNWVLHLIVKGTIQNSSLVCNSVFESITVPFQIIDERHQQLVRDIDSQRANLDEEKRQLDEDRKRIGVAGAIAGPAPRHDDCQSLLRDRICATKHCFGLAN